jgi:hypothetical protein
MVNLRAPPMQVADAPDDMSPDTPFDASRPDTPTDASPDATKPPPHLTNVNGRVHTTCHQVFGDADKPTDLLTSVIQVLVPDDSPGGYVVVNGHGDANGAFAIEDIPDDVTFTLRIDDVYYVTVQHMVDPAVRAEPVAPRRRSRRLPLRW